MKKVAILVSQKYYEENHVDDLMLKEELIKNEISADIVRWDDKEIDFSMYDLAIIRSCWDYDSRVDEFLQVTKKISEKTKLFNSYDIITENSNKTYLKTLKEKGIDVIETEFFEYFEDIEKFLNSTNFKKIVIKPSVSASGKNTYRVDVEDREKILECVKEILDMRKTVMIQEYFESVETVGEKSVIIIDSIPVFAIKKVPKDGEFLVHKHMGGTYIKDEITKEDEVFFDKILNTFEDKPLYMRVDILFDRNNKHKLLELELIEPNLSLSIEPNALEKLVCGIKKILKI